MVRVVRKPQAARGCSVAIRCTGHVPPRLITRNIRHVVPVAVRRQPYNHGVDHAAASQRRATGVVDAEQLAAGGRAALADEETAIRREPGQMGVLVVARVTIGIVLDEEVPRHRGRVLAKAKRGRCVAGLDQEDAVAGLREVHGQRPSARPGPNHNVVVHVSCRGRRRAERGRREEAERGDCAAELPKRLVGHRG